VVGAEVVQLGLAPVGELGQDRTAHVVHGVLVLGVPLERLDEGWLPDIDAGGAAKLLVTVNALRLRRYRPEEFLGYRPLPAQGSAAEHAVAFQRSPKLVAVATRLPVGLAARGGWGDTVLPLPDGATDWHDVLTDQPVASAAPMLSELLARYPVALLVRPA